jgi:hypothetical protein
MVMQIFANEICYKLLEMLNEKVEIQGTIHSVFNRVCNITFKDWPIVSLLLDSVPMKPMAVSFKLLGNISMHELEMEVGQRVIYCEDKLMFPQLDLKLSLNKARTIDCRPVFEFEKRSIEEVRENIKELRLILQQGNIKGLLPIASEFDEGFEDKHRKLLQNRYSEFALPRVNKLVLAIKEGNLQEIFNASRGIAGFGPGLTPASDDMLIGLMISLIYAGEYYGLLKGHAEAINSALLKGAEGRTTQLSYEMMSFAANGEVTKNLHQLISAIYFSSEKDLYDSTLAVMDYGETSGSDMLLGIYLGCKVCTSLK